MLLCTPRRCRRSPALCAAVSRHVDIEPLKSEGNIGGDAGGDLFDAVQICLGQSPSGNCTCVAPSGCGGYIGPIGTWDTSNVTDMSDM